MPQVSQNQPHFFFMRTIKAPDQQAAVGQFLEVYMYVHVVLAKCVCQVMEHTLLPACFGSIRSNTST